MTQPNLYDYKKHPRMVRWFRPLVLIDAARRAIISALFGEYADRRLIHAALDSATEEELFSRCEPHIRDEKGGATPVAPSPEGVVWVDYVADIGDGFDSTYAIAYLLAQKTLSFPGHEPLPRGQALIMGGDQVYPVATRDEYSRRMNTPYSYAFPDSKLPGTIHPPLYLIPGNHDWYDGLVLFLAKFCRGIETALGSWRAVQYRSYFVLRLPFNWWIWGMDTGLTADIDIPQHNYFTAIARRMPADAKVILCNSVPSWLKAEQSSKNPAARAEYFMGLDYVAHILKAKCPSAKVLAVLSGDQHHYSRYSANKSGAQFVTAGGGGAFLHPTHSLKDEIHVTWMGEAETLSLKTEPGGNHNPAAKEACYPSREQSRKLAWGNWKFPLVNWDFSLILGGIYLTIVLLSNPQSMGNNLWNLPFNPIFLGAVALLVTACVKYAEGHSVKQKYTVGVLHSFVHIGWIIILLNLLPQLSPENWNIGSFWDFIVLSVTTVAIGGFGGGLIWGTYLIIVSRMFNLHNNDAFSAMRLDSYKNFLRMRISQNQLTIYPVGLEQAPKRSDWEVNPNAQKGNQDEPAVRPKHPLSPILIEDPIVVNAARQP